jgi:hypothetical protein
LQRGLRGVSCTVVDALFTSPPPLLPLMSLLLLILLLLPLLPLLSSS